MGKLIACALLLCGACKHQGDAPTPSPLQDGAIVKVADAAVAVAQDAAPSAAPVTATKVVVGPHATCAIMSDHSVRCWGANGDGQLGDGTQNDATAAAPVTPAIRGVQELVLGDDHACVLLDDASVACWGKIAFGAKPGPTLVPTGVPGVHDMVRVFAVGGAGCSTAKDGPLVCWGDVDARGHVTSTGAHRTPAPVPGVDHVTVLAPRAALRDNGDVSLWLDDGAPTSANVHGMTELATRDGATCALGGDGAVRCFGASAPCATPPKPAPPPPPPPPHRGRGHGPRKAGLAKLGAVKPAPTPPTPPVAPPPPALPFGTKIAHLAFGAGVCAVSAAKQVVCIDVDHACKLTRPWPALVTVEQAAGACARLNNGTVRCAASAGAAPAIAGVTGATRLSAIETHGCAITAAGCVACWDGTGAVSTPACGR